MICQKFVINQKTWCPERTTIIMLPYQVLCEQQWPRPGSMLLVLLLVHVVHSGSLAGYHR